MKMAEKSTMVACILAGVAGLAFAQSADDALSVRTDEVVRSQMQEQKIPGVSLAVMREGKILKATGYGLANLELNVPVTPESVFHSESVGKTFTAVGVLILVDDGKVALHDKITKYFPEAPAAWKEVTVRQLLTHTSGITDYLGEFGGKSFVDLQKNYTEDEVVRIIAGQPLDFQPGEKRAYSNSGYVILGALIRRVTGKNWADFLQEHIFGPLGMASTRVISEADIIPNRTSGYHLVNGQWKNTDWVAPSLNTLADGTLYTNILDMAKWDEALSTEKILKRTTIDQMWIPIKLNNGTIFPQGLCFRIDNINGHRLAWKDGEFQGYTTIMSRYLDDHLTVVVLTNLGEDATIPLHIAERVAALYIPGLDGSSAKTSDSPAKMTDNGEIAAGPEMDRLKFYIGDWAYTEEYSKSELFPNGGHNTGDWSAQRGPGGLSVINTFSSHGGGDNYRGMEVMMWDPKAKEYRDNALWYDSPDRWVFTGNFDGETLVYRGEFDYLGKHVKFRSETKPVAGGGFTLTEFASVNGRPEQLLLKGFAKPR
jgi:CubicO group peptidase (beta-lactamase class C family)